MIDFSHVYKTYSGSTHALKNVDLKVEKAEFVFLTGPSGAGKTTLFKMISAYDCLSSGSATVAGYDLAKLNESSVPKFRRKIGIVFQDFKLLNNRTIFENVALPLEVRGENENSIQRKVTDILEQVGLIDKKDQYPDTLSGGEQQRTAIARALVHQPGLIIADEPTGNLDPKLAEEIMDLFEKACLQGTTVVIATHDHEMVARRKKRRIEIHQGMIVGDHP